MKMHYTLSPTGFVSNVHGVSRLIGFVPSTACTTAPAHFVARPSPFGRIRRF